MLRVDRSITVAVSWKQDGVKVVANRSNDLVAEIDEGVDYGDTR